MEMQTASESYRLVTRSDFDGLVCAVLLKELGMLDSIKFVHPKDIQDGIIDITDRDILTNLPYVDECYLCFDHHSSEQTRTEGTNPENHVLNADADSAARVVYEHFGGSERFPEIPQEMLEAVDKCDAARFSREDILNPQGWELLSFIMDPRTGLGRFRDFRISNYQLMMDLIDYCKDHSIDQILALPDVQERADMFFSHQKQFKEQLQRCATMQGNLVVLDLRDEETIFVGNRFMIYALFPQSNISMHVLWGLQKQNTVFTIGKSILDRSSNTNIGELCLRHGGGGHENAGTCQIPNQDAERIQDELIAEITADQPMLV